MCPWVIHYVKTRKLQSPLRLHQWSLDDTLENMELDHSPGRESSENWYIASFMYHWEICKVVKPHTRLYNLVQCCITLQRVPQLWNKVVQPWAKLNNSVYYFYGQLLYYIELYNCSQPAADLVKFDVNNSCKAAPSYFDKGHCYWMPLIVETMFSLKRVRSGHALHLLRLVHTLCSAHIFGNAVYGYTVYCTQFSFS